MSSCISIKKRNNTLQLTISSRNWNLNNGIGVSLPVSPETTLTQTCALFIRLPPPRLHLKFNGISSLLMTLSAYSSPLNHFFESQFLLIAPPPHPPTRLPTSPTYPPPCFYDLLKFKHFQSLNPGTVRAHIFRRRNKS